LRWGFQVLNDVRYTFRQLAKQPGFTAVAVLTLGLAYVGAPVGLPHRVRLTDPVTYAVIALLMAAATGTACYVPARRAARVHPMEALRDE
jgi:ABC-type lipoprotein release transport system permease subunit